LTIFITSCVSQDQNGQLTEKNTLNESTCLKLKDLDVFQYTIANSQDSIQYIKIGTDTTTVKPTIIFLQGSLPVPLVIDFKDFKHVNIPFKYNDLLEDFHLIEISMPRTPIETEMKNLNSQYCFVTDTSIENSFKKDYLKDNYLDNYVLRTNEVILDLLNKNWIDKEQIHIVGHSQGAKIATVVASQNENVASVSLLGFNAYGRFDENIRRERNKMRHNQITGEEYLANLDYHYQKWEDINQKPNEYENGNLNWTTFSIDYIPYMLKIDVPIFVGFGTEDISAENCDLLPIVFIENKKSNLTIKPYIGLEHNFFEIKGGKPNYQSGGHWTEVINDIKIWKKQNNDTLIE
jgi:predicted esterase